VEWPTESSAAVSGRGEFILIFSRHGNVNDIVFCLQVYGRRGEWRGWDDFLSRETSPGLEEEDDDDDASTGAGGITRRRRRRINRFGYRDARAKMRELASAGAAPRTSKQFQQWRQRPKEIPPNPRVVYLRSGEWLGWDDFLGRAKVRCWLAAWFHRRHVNEART